MTFKKTFSDHFLSELLRAATQTALEAGALLKTGFSSSYQIFTKSGQHDLVTDYDRKAEKFIIENLLKIFPDHSFLGEESGSSHHQEDSVLWIIDPLDGTVNFAHHIPFFSVSLAATFQGEILCGVVYNPMTDELFTAQKGGGAFFHQKKLEVTKTTNLEGSFLATGFPYNLKENPHHCRERLNKILEMGNPLRRLGSAALDLAYLAAGRFDGFWEVALHPWDLAAGVLLVQEAGGTVTQLDGGPIGLVHPTSLLASNSLLHSLLIEKLKP